MLGAQNAESTEAGHGQDEIADLVHVQRAVSPRRQRAELIHVTLWIPIRDVVQQHVLKDGPLLGPSEGCRLGPRRKAGGLLLESFDRASITGGRWTRLNSGRTGFGANPSCCGGGGGGGGQRDRAIHMVGGKGHGMSRLTCASVSIAGRSCLGPPPSSMMLLMLDQLVILIKTFFSFLCSSACI